jgi:hypothetical protein
MIFSVGPWGYRVVVVRGLSNDAGIPLMGRADYDGRRIYLCADLDPMSRSAVLLHELRHAWTYHVGKPADEEGEADLLATIAESYRRDLASQGGLNEILALLPAGEGTEDTPDTQRPPALQPAASERYRYVPVCQVEPAEHSAPARAGRAQCATCETIVADGSVVSSDVRWDATAKGMILTRTLYCAHCHALQTWDEGCNAAGVPNGAVVRGPILRRGDAVDEFLAEHEEAAGMVAC